MISQPRTPRRPTWARRPRGPDPTRERRHAVHFWTTVPRCCGNPLKPLPVSAAGSYCSSLGFTSTHHPISTSIFSNNLSIYQSVFSIAGLLWRHLILTPESPPPPPPVFPHNLFKRSYGSGAGLHIYHNNGDWLKAEGKVSCGGAPCCPRWVPTDFLFQLSPLKNKRRSFTELICCESEYLYQLHTRGIYNI